ncbi:putative phosphoglycerate mutase family protein [Mycena maculata]|uniref:Phosphoglycerate mutase family protein n=1 Tax=Mycena maculata TaxID=230809 RepID=A0AAD7NCQ3_9AGAR|nr:putative phosphoglycerate mutase family protein [Mycena maculata]
MPFGWGEHSKEHKDLQAVNSLDPDNHEHKAALSHELIAGAAAYEAAKAYEKHCAEKNGGQPTSHAEAKKIMAAAGAMFIDHLFETKGLDAIDKHKEKKEQLKKEAAEQAYEAGKKTQAETSEVIFVEEA